MDKAAKRSAKRAQGDRAAAGSGGSTESPVDKEGAATSVSTPRSAVESSPSRDTTEHAQLQLLVKAFGRAFEKVTRMLIHKRKGMRVAGWISLVVLLGLPTFVVLVPLLSWEPVEVIVFYAGGTGVTAVANLVVKRFLRKSQ